ncbi:hypothetical protein ACQKL5_13680 [Peribacillus sp. NPDC097675]|uniref:hypothetical protein n=1 Tax=Peribacillus sp. NPDC097675 TaxID=3390618 RepID=UPI003CFF2F12
MKKKYEPRYFFLVIGLLIAVISPIFLLIFPQAIADAFHYKTDIWQVYVPGVSFVGYGIGLTFLVFAALLLFFLDIKKVSIILSIFFVGLSLTFFYLGSQSYKSLSEDSISYSTLLSLKEYSYSWDDVKKINYYKGNDDEFSKYVFFFSDGNSLSLSENGYIKKLKFMIIIKTEDLNIKMENFEKG